MGIKDREIELFNKYRAGDQEAKRELLFSLEPLITHQVSRYKTSGLPEPAIKLEGKRLAAIALESYDPKKAQLNTHVVNNLKKLTRYVENYQNVGKIPEPRALMIGTYNTIKSNLESDLGRTPSISEIADAMSVPQIEIERLQQELRKDLSMVMQDDEDAGGFYEFMDPTKRDPRLDDAIEFVYFEADPLDKSILEYTLGIKGQPQLKANQIVTKLNITNAELKRRKEELAKQIQELS